MTPALYIGIDNGASGGIAAICADGSVFRVDPMPATDVEILAVLEAIREGAPHHAGAVGVFAVLEHAQAFPKMGVSSAFNYGRGYGAIQTALAAAGIGFDIVVPRKWQAALGCLTRGDKNVSKRRAEQLFPGRKITHAIADALLIAEYCRRVRLSHGEKEKDERQGGQASAFREAFREVGARFDARAAAAGGAPGDGADPEQAARSPVRRDRRRAGKNERVSG